MQTQAGAWLIMAGYSGMVTFGDIVVVVLTGIKGYIRDNYMYT